jgi:hypothetical protein
MAGVSSAAGSKLRRRIEQIMNNEYEKKRPLLHRALVAAMALAILVFTIAAGVMSHDRILAQQESSNEKPSGGAQGGIPGGVIGGVTEIQTLPFAPGDTSASQSNEGIDQQLDRASEESLQYDNSDQPPVIITDAKIRSVASKTGNYAVRPTVTLLNTTHRKVKGIILAFSDGKKDSYTVGKSQPVIDPGASFTWKARFFVKSGDPSSYSIKVLGVV